MLSERRLRDWVALLGFDVASVYGYLGHAADRIGRRTRRGSAPHAAWRAGAYMLKARKRVQTMTLVRPKRRARQRVLVGVAEPTNKVGP
jgi:hypothetical protein